MKTVYRNIKGSIYKYRRSKHGLVALLYNNQKGNCRNKNRDLPSYTLNELRDWVFSCKHFLTLFSEWEQSGYSKLLTPSIDRKNPLEGYTLSNIQLMTWSENLNKGRKEMTITQGKPVEQYSNGELIGVYLSLTEAWKQTGVDFRQIGNCLKGRRKTAKGFEWKYANLTKSQLKQIWEEANL